MNRVYYNTLFSTNNSSQTFDLRADHLGHGVQVPRTPSLEDQFPQQSGYVKVWYELQAWQP